jgi:hypothetical protein
MNRLLVAMISATAILLAATSASPTAARSHRHHHVSAVGPNDLYCLQGRIWGYPGNCQSATYAQCMASASGTDAYCGMNPQYAFARRQ